MKIIVRKISAAVVCVLSLVLFFCNTMKACAYNEITVTIPVSCYNVTNSGSFRQAVIIEPENNYSPAPETSTLIFTKNGTSEFKINISEPGTFTYRIYDSIETNTHKILSSNEFSVTVFVENSSDDELAYSISARDISESSKASAIEFKSKTLSDEIIVTSTSSAVTSTTTISETSSVTSSSTYTSTVSAGVEGTDETTSSSETTSSLTYSATTTSETVITSIKNQTPIKEFIDAVKTGDSFNTPLLGLVMASSSLTAASAFLLRHKKRKEEENDDE